MQLPTKIATVKKLQITATTYFYSDTWFSPKFPLSPFNVTLTQRCKASTALAGPFILYLLATYFAAGVYHIGDDQARSWMVAGTNFESGRPFLAES